MKRTLTVEYGEEVLVALGISAEDFRQELKLLTAIKLYELGRLSAGAAASFAGIPTPVFLTKLSDYGVESLHLTEEEVLQDLANARDDK